jgi:hypothetical protein
MNDEKKAIISSVLLAFFTTAFLAAVALLANHSPSGCGCGKPTPATTSAVPDLAEHSIVVRRE